VIHIAKKYICPECGQRLKTLGALYGHLRWKHGWDLKDIEKKMPEVDVVETPKEKPIETETKVATAEEESFGAGLEEDFINNLKFAGLVGGHWEQKRKGIAKLFFAGEPTPERLFWAMKKAGATPLQIDLMLHLWFGDGVNFDEIAKKAEKIFEKPKKSEEEEEEIDWEEIDMDEEKLRKIVRGIIKEMQKEESSEEADIWRRIDRIMAYRTLERMLSERPAENTLRQLLELKPLLGNDQLAQRIAEIEKKLADERDKAILEALIRVLGDRKSSDASDLIRIILEQQTKNQEAIEKLKEKAEEMRYQSLKEYLDRVLSLVAERESWDEDLKKLIKEEMTKTLKEKIKSSGPEKSKAEIAREVIETTIDKMKEPILRPIGEALAENIRKGRQTSPLPNPAPNPTQTEDLARLERQKKQLELIKDAELPKE